MANETRQSLQRLWRNRILLSASGLVVLGFSGLQVKAILKHRPQHPLWSLEFSSSLEDVLDESNSQEKREQEAEYLLALAQSRNLQETGSVLSWALARKIDLEQEQKLAQEKAQRNETKLEQAQQLEQKKVRELEQADKQALESAQALEQEMQLELARKQERKLAQMRKKTNQLIIARERVSELEQILEQTLELEMTLDLAIDEVTTKLVNTATEELQQVHGITIQQDRALETLLSGEPSRDQALLQSSILLALSLLILVSVLLTLQKSRSRDSWPTATHISAFFPEDYASEVGIIYRRLKKAETSNYKIYLRLCQELLAFIWASLI